MFASLSILLSTFGAAAGQSPIGIEAERLYNNPHQPLMVRVSYPVAAERLHLAMMDFGGELILQSQPVRRGRLDLRDAFGDELWNIRFAAYVQLLVDGEPAGPSLVLQPLLQPMAPRIEQHLRADGTSTTHIVGWEAPDPRTFSGFRAYVEHDVMLHTDHGDIRIALRPDHAPNTVWNFRRLVEGGFYDDVPFHRIVPYTGDGRPFVIQSGDPTGTGRGGPGYAIALEPSELPHDFGVISMARSDDPDSAGSQFFICLSREGTAGLDGQYCSFGYAVDGATAISSIADVELADVSTGRPRRPPMIERAALAPAPPRVPEVGRPDARISRERPQPDAQPPGRVPR